MQLITEASVAETANGEIYPCVQLHITKDDGSTESFSMTPDVAKAHGLRLIEASGLCVADFNVCRLAKSMSMGMADRQSIADTMNTYRRLREEG